MARESVDLEALTRIDANELIEALNQENSQLRLENTAQKTVINRLIKAVQELDGQIDEDDAE
jgi:hypothetical protein